MESDAISMLDLAALNAAELHRSPFPFGVVPSFVKEEARAAIDAEFPKIDRPGSIPVRSVKYGPAFETFLAEIQGSEFAAALGAKLDVDLVALPTMVTVRGLCRARDGQVHTDSKTKVVTVLIYLNPTWTAEGGRLRMLRSSIDINDFDVEVAPENGNLVAFPCAENAYHAHASYVGQRRTVQLNWVTSRWVVRREQMRHRLSARLKKLAPSSGH